FDLLFFFFSSRRRHTRSKRDWSSDVCSSDLLRPDLPGGSAHPAVPGGASPPPREPRGVPRPLRRHRRAVVPHRSAGRLRAPPLPDRKSTRLNSSHVSISYAVFCLKKKRRHDI